MWRLPCNFYNVIIVQMKHNRFMVKFMYSEKAIKFCEIFTLLLPSVVRFKIKLRILQNFVAFSEYMNFILSSMSHGLYWGSVVKFLVWLPRIKNFIQKTKTCMKVSDFNYLNTNWLFFMGTNKYIRLFRPLLGF